MLQLVDNGDSDLPKKTQRVLARTYIDAIMTEYATRGRLLLFSKIDHYLKIGSTLQQPTISKVRDIILENLKNFHSFDGEHSGLRPAHKYIA